MFSYKVYRDMPIQGYVTDEELERILAVIDTGSDIRMLSGISLV